jgi:AcrR family transcriptional regulator
MIDTAIEVFGTLGYEGASTRILTDRAGVNLSAIPYHFGGKRELYMAAAQSIADYARKQIDPVVADLEVVDGVDPAARIDEALSRFFHFMVGGPEPEAWASFFVRCEYDADDAFRMIHEETRCPLRTSADQDRRRSYGLQQERQGLANAGCRGAGYDREPPRTSQYDAKQSRLGQVHSRPPRATEPDHPAVRDEPIVLRIVQEQRMRCRCATELSES